jgi:hypothetical protein
MTLLHEGGCGSNYPEVAGRIIQKKEGLDYSKTCVCTLEAAWILGCGRVLGFTLFELSKWENAGPLFT